jgi:predicted transcriptional regulator
MPLHEAAAALAEHQIGGAAVCTPEGKVVGVITKTDLTEAYGSAEEGRAVADVMTPEVLAVRPDDLVERAVHLMVFEGVHRLFVIDRTGALSGIVTSMDVLRELAGVPRRAQRVEAVAPPERGRDRRYIPPFGGIPKIPPPAPLALPSPAGIGSGLPSGPRSCQA